MNDGRADAGVSLAGRSSDPDALFREALRRHQAGQLREAECILAASLRAVPGQPDAWNLLGATLESLRRSKAAEQAYREALARQANHPGALNNLAVLLRQTGRIDEAHETYRVALQHWPDHVDAWNNLGALYATRQQYAEALSCYRRVLQLDPDYGYALGAAANAMAMICDWSARSEVAQRLIAGLTAGKPVSAPFALLSQIDDPELQLACARRWSQRFHIPGLKPPPAYPAHDRIRAAYLSADLREHPVGLQIGELIEAHDRSRFECFAVYSGPRLAGDATYRRLRTAFDSFLDIAQLPDDEAARRLRALEIDILVDLGGHTLDARPGIVARRPAPIQVNWLGYPGTAGSTAIDYLLADRFVVPPEHRQAYSERLVYLPGSFWVSDSRIAPAATVPSREDLGLPGDALVFCCFNHSYKINPQMFDIWMRVLRQTERSVLWLLAANPEVELRLRQQAERRGVAPARIVFAPRIALAAHLARHSRADLFLDTLPFNAITTTSSALRAGVPVLTCAGCSFAARAAGSLLHAAGLSSLVTDDLAAYERKALELAGDPARIDALRRALGEQLRAGPLFDAVRFRRALEAAYGQMWERCRRGEAPIDIGL